MRPGPETIEPLLIVGSSCSSVWFQILQYSEIKLKCGRCLRRSTLLVAILYNVTISENEDMSLSLLLFRLCIWKCKLIFQYLKSNKCVRSASNIISQSSYRKKIYCKNIKSVGFYKTVKIAHLVSHRWNLFHDILKQTVRLSCR